MTIPQSKPLLFPKDILLLREFKALLNRHIRRLRVAQRFKPRLYANLDYILVKFYALSTAMSIEMAAERLNQYFAGIY